MAPYIIKRDNTIIYRDSKRCIGRVCKAGNTQWYAYHSNETFAGKYGSKLLAIVGLLEKNYVPINYAMDSLRD